MVTEVRDTTNTGALFSYRGQPNSWTRVVIRPPTLRSKATICAVT